MKNVHHIWRSLWMEYLTESYQFMDAIVKKRGKINLVILHVSIWLAYAVVIYLIGYLSDRSKNFIPSLLFLLPFIATFYLIVFCLGLYKKINILWSVLSFFIVFALMTSLGYLYIFLFLPTAGVTIFSTKDFNIFLHEALLGYVRYFAYAAFYFYARETSKNERQLRVVQAEKAKVEREKIERELENALLKQTELQEKVKHEKEKHDLEKEKLQLVTEKLQLEFAFLRAQINPHFLHNTLNVLFSKALNFSPELADNILKLSRIMRYSIESLEYENGRVPVQKELENLQILLDIHNMRFGDSKIIKYSSEGEANGQMLPPLSFLTIIENAFKYGDLKDPDHPMEIKVVLKPRDIYFYCFNKKKRNFVSISSTHIGITNLSKRLDESFKNKYEMKVTEEKEFYTFELFIKN